MIKMMGGCWAFCSIVPFVFMMAGKTGRFHACPILIGSNQFEYGLFTGYDNDNHHCCMTVRGDVGWTVAYWIVIIAPLLLFCDGTMIYCNYHIYKKLHEHASHQDLDKNVIRKHKEILYFLLADMMFPIM